MEVTFLTHDKYFLKKMEGVSLGRWLFFAVWITEYLYKQYGSMLRPAFLEEDDLDLAEVLAFLWETVDRVGADELPLNAPLDLNSALIAGFMSGLGDDAIYNDLDQTDTDGIGQAVLISAFYNSLKFIQERNTRLVAAAAFFPMDIIDCVLTNELELSHDESTIDHPMYQAELATQDRLIAYLHSGAPVGEEEKDIFRGELIP